MTGITIKALTCEGLNPTRHDLNLLSNGDLGWIHITLPVLTGVLTIARAVGIRCAPRSVRGGTSWGPLLVGLYGLGRVGARNSVADPMGGFPPGTLCRTPAP